MSSGRLLSDVYKTHSLLLLLLALFLGNCCAQTSPNCVSVCGNIHNISHPFRLKEDPENCGNKKYELECEHDRLVLYLNSSAKYYVHAINYDNYTIRLVDVGLKQGSCSSLPLHSLSDLNFSTYDDKNQYSLDYPSRASYPSVSSFIFYYSDHPFPWDVAVALWVDCEKPVKSRFYTESNTSASSCIDKATSSSSSSSLSSGEKRRYSYFLFGSLKLKDVADQCKIDEIRITTLWLPADKSQANISYSDFHSKLEHGFELSWLSFLCEQCPERLAYCEIGSNYTNTIAAITRCTSPGLFHVRQLKFFYEGKCSLSHMFSTLLVHNYFIPGYKVRGFDVTEGNISLSCKQMYDISVGVARGIEYLHQGCDMQILHFDIKPHNILLDENFNPKVSDFGLAKLYSTDNSMVSLTTARGTMGYMAPELFYKNIGRVSYKADVYSYGMLLMEMAGRRRNLNAFADQTSQIYFPSWIYDQFKEGKEIKMGEATEEEREMVRKMVITALWCIQMRPSDRPSMNKVLEMLEGNIEALEMPPKPFLTPQELPIEDQ
ncbi:hypothetical protein RHMOL_Rhmol06G0165100 [Rhododendron molle]|uniref:Uncharacterized protein n=1 Tax=Rhododendron molle TaxID=49168 RepID=A0ACC0NE52_RHOML|nr:hypothetical protein RHMOL_Rhmol06G0165100 [Rhododendron molle]